MLPTELIIEKTGISWATLNNYISCGVVPKPEISPSDSKDGTTPRVGYFPDDVLQRIAEIQRLKEQGWSMTRIAEYFASGQSAPLGAEARSVAADEPVRGAMPRLTVEEIVHPAYMVNQNFELIWFNDAARKKVLGNFAQLPVETEARSVFRYLHSSDGLSRREEILRFHFGMAKQCAPKSSFFNLCRTVPREALGKLERLYNEAERPGSNLISQTFIARGPLDTDPICLYAVQFREGILFVHAPDDGESADLLTLLSRRDLVIRDLVRKRLPVLTHVAVMVTDLQHSTKICSELPPEEYFELINEIRSLADPIFRRHYGTYGKHAGDGMVYYFFPQPDSSYVWNALLAAQEVRTAMRRLSKDWQLRKGWNNELYLNTGLNEGQEWLGTFQLATHVEFTVLGDTINHAARLSDFARFGSVWATKNLIGKLTSAERQMLKYGVRRTTNEGQNLFVASTYSTVSSLTDLVSCGSDKLKDIAALPITEIIDIQDSGPG